MAQATVDGVDSDDQFVGNHHVYQPYRAGLPPLKPYAREFWRRREFMSEMSTANIRAENMDSWFGRLWTVLNPLLLGAVYFLLVNILSNRGMKPGYFVYLLAGLFLFSTLQLAMSEGARSVTGAGKIITNTAFPRALLPIAAVRTAFGRFWPTLIVLFAMCLLNRIYPSVQWLWCIPVLIILFILSSGIAMLLATIQVYFRDTRSFLPYMSRIWLYISPVLWMPQVVPEKLRAIEFLNPMFGVVGTWSEAIVYHQSPKLSTLLLALAWALLFFVVGAYAFLSRERDFAVRI